MSRSIWRFFLSFFGFLASGFADKVDVFPADKLDFVAAGVIKGNPFGIDGLNKFVHLLVEGVHALDGFLGFQQILQGGILLRCPCNGFDFFQFCRKFYKGLLSRRNGVFRQNSGLPNAGIGGVRRLVKGLGGGFRLCENFLNFESGV